MIGEIVKTKDGMSLELVHVGSGIPLFKTTRENGQEEVWSMIIDANLFFKCGLYPQEGKPEFEVILDAVEPTFHAMAWLYGNRAETAA